MYIHTEHTPILHHITCRQNRSNTMNEYVQNVTGKYRVNRTCSNKSKPDRTGTLPTGCP